MPDTLRVADHTYTDAHSLPPQMTASRDPGPVVEHRDDRDRPAAGRWSGSTSTFVGSGSASRPPSGCLTRQRASCPIPTTGPVRRSARSRSARGSRSPPCRCSSRTTRSPTTGSTCRPRCCGPRRRRGRAPPGACPASDGGWCRRPRPRRSARCWPRRWPTGTGKAAAIDGYDGRRQDGHCPQAPARRRLPGRPGQLPLRRHLRRVHPRRRSPGVDHRRHRRADDVPLRRRRRRPRLRQDRPPRPADHCGSRPRPRPPARDAAAAGGAEGSGRAAPPPRPRRPRRRPRPSRRDLDDGAATSRRRRRRARRRDRHVGPRPRLR